MTIINIDAPRLHSNGQKILTQLNKIRQSQNNLAALADEIEWHASWIAEDLRSGGDLKESFAYFNEAVGKFYAALNEKKKNQLTEKM